MPTRTRRNVYFDPALLKQLEAAMSRRLDKISRQIDTLDEDLAVLGETLSLFILIWLSSTPPLPENAQAAARAKGAERFEGFMQNLGRRLASGDRFLKELSRDVESIPEGPTADRQETSGAPPE